MEKNVQNSNMSEREKAERRRRNRLFNTVLYCISACLVLFGIFIILREKTDIFSKNSAVTPQATFPPEVSIPTNTPAATARVTEDIASVAPLPSQTPPPTPEPTAPPPSPPVSVAFIDYDIAVKVEPVGVNDKGEMDTIPRYDIAGWYMYGACPNQVGNCIIAGHNRYGGQKGLFAILHNGMKEGDRVSVTMENGETIFYRVVSLNRNRYDYVPAEVMAPSPDQRLTLITCLGDYDWDLHMSKTRVVAVCEPVEQ